MNSESVDDDGFNFADEATVEEFDIHSGTAEEPGTHSDLDDTVESTNIPVPVVGTLADSFLDTGIDDGSHHVHSDAQSSANSSSTIQHTAFKSTVHSNAPINLSNWYSLVSEAGWSLPARVPVLPWERGIMSSIFGERIKQTVFQRVAMPPCHSYSSSSTVAVDVCNHAIVPVIHSDAVWTTVAKRVQNIKFNDHLEARREYALSKWRTLLQIDSKHSELGRILLNDVLALQDDKQIVRTIEDVFCHKSTATLLKRANSLSKYVLWTTRRGMRPYPIQESQVYQYLNEHSGVSPSFASSLKEALNFSQGTLGLDGSKKASESPRISGLCRKRILERRPLEQAQVLTVKQVKQLESFLENDNKDRLDRCFIGHCLFCLFARARWSDSMFIKRFHLDIQDETQNGFVQGDTLVSKTSTTVAKKRRFLPLTAVTEGISSNTWAQSWFQLRIDCNLPEPDGTKPVIAHVLKNGTFGKAPLSTTDASKWLRDIIKTFGHKSEDVKRISTHSLKATTLSWCAKAGISEETRRTLGYHIQPGSISLLHYSRDCLSGPLRELEKVLALIREGTFFPDASRSGYFPPRPKAVAAPRLDPMQSKIGQLVQLESDDELIASNSSERSHSHDMSDDEQLAKAVPTENETISRRRSQHAGSQFFVHSRWKTLHVSHSSDMNKLACGRAISGTYRPVYQYPEFVYTHCITCLGPNP